MNSTNEIELTLCINNIQMTTIIDVDEFDFIDILKMLKVQAQGTGIHPDLFDNSILRYAQELKEENEN